MNVFCGQKHEAGRRIRGDEDHVREIRYDGNTDGSEGFCVQGGMMNIECVVCEDAERIILNKRNDIDPEDIPLDTCGGCIRFLASRDELCRR